MFLLVPAYPGCPGSKAVKRLLLLLHYQSARLAVGLVTLGRDLIAIVIDFVLTVFTIGPYSQEKYLSTSRDVVCIGRRRRCLLTGARDRRGRVGRASVRAVLSAVVPRTTFARCRRNLRRAGHSWMC